MKIIYILGVDGSGKTTLAENLVRQLNSQKNSFYYCYAQHIPFLLKPLKFIAKKTLMRSTDEFKDYSRYKDKKTEHGRKKRKLGYIYGLIWMLDYFLITSTKVLYHRLLGHNLIVDRYFLDIVVNISETLQLNDLQMIKFAKYVSKIFYLPSVYYFIDVPEDVAFLRKKDIQSIQYLTERKNRYQKLSEIFNFKYFDGTKSPDELLKTVFASIITT